jgi:hypothetical protein
VIITASPDLVDGVQLTGRWGHKVGYAHISDGSSNTFLAGETHIPRDKFNTTPFNGPIFNGLELYGHSRVGGSGIPILTQDDEPGAVLGFGSVHPGTCNFVNADGSTHSIRADIDTIVLANLCNRCDGEVIGAID